MKREKKSLKERYLGLDELARYLGVDKKIIINKAQEGEIKLIKKGQDLFCPVQDLEKLTRAFVSPEEISSIAKRMIDDYGSLFKRLA
ncbi:hypothetical protein B6D52_02020 [Candidatus Parcubacteria bacterium 4484_255]|nr:MAG: hypothetical protein B6D52_02020 [Candidatus Parcubacteria bacterium 4484_255]